jgi:putative tryptophan/tyrosine transport system substrate-binding protein
MRRREFITLLGGAIVARPLAANAQGTGVKRVSVLMSTAESDPEEVRSVAAFVSALGKTGWVSGLNLIIDYRWGEGSPSRYQEYAKELIGLVPDVIFVKGAAVPAVAQATSAIPIVFTTLSDHLAERYVANFAQPNGNVTGFTSDELALIGKRLEILKEISPDTSRAIYIRGARPETEPLFLRAREIASQADLTITDCAANNDEDIEKAIDLFARQGGGIITAFDAFNIVHNAKIIELAERYHLPAVYFYGLFVRNGGLVSYGINQAEQFAQAAGYVDRILRGEKLSNLPVQYPTKFEFFVNLKTAKALGVTVPAILRATADEVIE